nr:ScbR family autoregulator-binding transcription factor [Streptomyces taklimakanensis]
MVEAAAEQFTHHGFGQASLAGISRHAGLTKGALFFHFSTKDELADTVQEHAWGALERTLRELRSAEDSSLRVIVRATHALNRLLREDVFVRASVRITRERGGTEPKPLDFYTVWFGRLWKLLEEARTNGELRHTVTDASAQTLVTAAVSGTEALAWMGASEDEGEEWLDHLWDLALPMLVPEQRA